MSSNAVLFDELGSRVRRRVWYASVMTIVIVAYLIFVAINRLYDKGQFASELWESFTEWFVIKGLLLGLWQTIKAASLAMVFCIVIGVFMALGRLSWNCFIRWIAGIYVEFFRAILSLVIITFAFIGLFQFGIDLSSFWSVVVGFTLYNSAMLAEIFRAGILSLDRGQKEVATALGLSYWQSMRYVIVSQAGRRMVLGIISQLVALLKDTSLGVAFTFVELLKTATIYANYYGNLLQMLFVAALIYMLVNFCLSQLARRFEVRQRRRFRVGLIAVFGGFEDVSATFIV